MILCLEAIREVDMGHCYGNDLRRRVVAAIDDGMSARAAAARYSVAPSTAIHWHRRWRETGSVEPWRQGQPTGSKLDAHEAFILDLVASERDIALSEIAERLATEHGVATCPATIWYFFAKRGLTHKKRQAMHRNSSARMSSPAGSVGSTVRPTSIPNG